MLRVFAIFVSLLVVSSHSYGDDAHHDHALGEQELGTIHFPVSCSSTVQEDFERGVALLHSFAFETAETTFRQVARNDPKCAMAHWGIARSFWRWAGPHDASTRRRGWQEIVLAKSLHAPTGREREYIDSVASLYRNPDSTKEKRWDNYVRKLEKLHNDYPEDHEATAFYASALTGAKEVQWRDSKTCGTLPVNAKQRCEGRSCNRALQAGLAMCLPKTSTSPRLRTHCFAENEDST